MQHPKLTAAPRTIVGKKVKQLRKAGKIPANVYGKHIESRSIQLSTNEFLSLYKEVGETGIIDLTVDGKAVPVLVKMVQNHVVTRQPLHVEFFQVNLKEKIKTFVPVRLVGEPKAVADKQGLLLQVLNEIEIEALPESLPEAIEADASSLEEVGDMLEVADLKAPEGVTILTDGGQAVAQVSELVVEEKEPEPVAEPVEGEAVPAAEGETPAEGTTPEAPTEVKAE